MQKRIEGMYKKQKTSRAVIIPVLLLLCVFAFAGFTAACNTNAINAGPLQAKDTQTAPQTTTATIKTDSTAIIEPDENSSNAGFLQDIVNIMLIGVDYSPERDTWSGKHAYHADTMIVLSINNKTNEVHLISLPRDTYAKIPGVDGIYKLNASIDCGGGWPTEGGFKKVCEAASWMLGNIPVNYYYAVDMSAFKGLVNAIGGVDYENDVAFTVQSRSYKKGMQHMNGQAALDYMRVRKGLEGGQSGDLGRMQRQQKLFIAILTKLKDSNMLTKLPDIIDSFVGSLYTNTTLSQTAALCSLMMQVNLANIKMHSMEGEFNNAFNWHFLFTDQKKRVALIKEIYGVDVPEYKEYTYEYANLQWQRMLAQNILDQSTLIMKDIKTKLDAKTNNSKAMELYKKAGEEVSSLAKYQSMPEDVLENANNQLKTDIESLCKLLSIPYPSWQVNFENTTNEVKVDFN